MVSQISVLGVTFHTYGLLLGIAILVGLHIFQRLVEKKYPFVTENTWYFSTAVVLLFAVFGARLWHVVTDFWLYQENMLSTLYIWNGGLSIFGGLLGGGLALLYVQKKWLKAVPRGALFDALALSLPFGQSIGRWANFVNQELYGLPTNLPWALFIDEPYRLAGYEHFERFHPLFLYESIAMVLFGFWLWRQQKEKQIGSGYFIKSYILFYTVVRFGLDFLRVGIPRGVLHLSANQAILLLVIGMLGVMYCMKRYRK